MAGGLVLMGIYSSIMPIASAMIMHGVTQFSSNGYRWWILRENTYWGGMPKYIFGLVAAVVAFFVLNIVPNKAWVFLFLGSLPYVVVLIKPIVKVDYTSKYSAAICGFIVSAVQLLAGAAGPALDVFFTESKLNKKAVVATKGITQTLGHAGKIIYFALLVPNVAPEAESFDIHPIVCASSIVATFVGTSIGNKVLEKFSDEQFRKYTRRIVLAIGAIYIYRSLRLFELV